MGEHDMTNRKDQNQECPPANSAHLQSRTAKGEGVDGHTTHDKDAEHPALDSRIQGLIGRQLRTHYDQLINDKVPDNLLKLLEDLAKSEVDPEKDQKR